LTEIPDAMLTKIGKDAGKVITTLQKAMLEQTKGVG